MKRLFVDDSEIAILSDRIFAKRLRIDDSHISNTSEHQKTSAVQHTDIVLEVEPVISVIGSIDHQCPPLNPTLAELHQEREERRKRKADKSSNQQIEYHHEPANSPGARSTEIPWHEEYLIESKLQGNPSNHFRKQMQYMSDYYSRCEHEQLNDRLFDEKMTTEESYQRLHSTALWPDRFNSNAESYGCWEHQPDKETIKHHPHYYMDETIYASHDDQDQMEVD